MEDKIVSSNFFPTNALPLSLKIQMEDDWGCPNSSDYDWILIEDREQSYVKVLLLLRHLPYPRLRPML